MNPKQKRKFFYRIETEKGVGLFQEVYYYDLFEPETRTVREEHPGPNRDPKLKDFWENLVGKSDQFHFGFANKKQIQKWFSTYDWRNLMRINRNRIQDGDHPLVVSVYLATVYLGESQVIYKKGDERRVATFDLNKFFKRTFKTEKQNG